MEMDNASPDLVLIAGRFRIVCFMSSLLNAQPGTRIVFDDYRDRRFDKSVESIIAPSSFQDRAAECVVPDRVPRDAAWSLLVHHAADAR